MFLNKISISNVRRFSENVDIQIEKGATVFIAPNGTGKTALFEAIELALTGKVRRLPPPPDALIRDSAEKSYVKLSFDSGKYCEVDFQKNGSPVLKGSHSEIFGSIPIEDLPFLLRLTHLLNQRNSEWFVQMNQADAGGELDHLAIGREANQINNLVLSAKRAATKAVEDASGQLAKAQESFDHWMGFLSKRSVSPSDLQQNLVDRRDIRKNLNVLGEVVRHEVLNSANLEDLKAYHEVVRQLHERSIERSRRQAAVLAELNGVVDGYETGIVGQKTAMDNVERSRASKAEVAATIAKMNEDYLNASNDLLRYQEDLLRYVGLRDLGRQLVEIDMEIDRLQKLIEENRGHQKENGDLLLKLKEDLSKSVHISKLYSAARDARGKLEEKKSTYRSNEELIQAWRTRIEELKDLEKQQAAFDSQKLESERVALRASQELNGARLELAALQNDFDSLNATSDLIKNAVGVIASNLPHDIAECPLCLHQYNENKILRENISRAVQRMNPLISQSVVAIDAKKTEVARLEKIHQNAAAESAAALEKTESNERSVLNTRRQIGSDFLNKISSASTPEEAMKNQDLLSEEIKKMEENLLVLSQNAADAGAETSAEGQQKTIDTIEAQLQVIGRRISEALADFKQKETEKLAVEKNISSYDPTDDIDRRIVGLEVVIADVKTKLESLNRSQENQQRILGQANDILINHEKTLNRVRISISELHSRWSSEGFSGQPDRDQLEKRRVDTETFIGVLDKNLAELDLIQNELLKWQAYETQFAVEKELKALRGDIPEDVFQEQLSENVIKLAKRLQDIEKKQSALLALFSHVDDQLDKINEQINSINPLWTKLLKRIVLDPRFAGTSLKSHIKNKKQRAEVTVGLHNEKFLASQIASEAQITDLQFTFLLSMAQTYQWCPWKALLLDDPTQHHDLVHAAGVFDLLRDYVAEQGFQVLLATHDSVHANFFVRKLQNDGIPTRIYRLKPDKDGVRAFSVG